MIPANPNTVEHVIPACDGASAEHQHATLSDTSKHVRQAVGMKRGADDNPITSSVKRARTSPPPLSQILSQSDVEMETVLVSMPEDAMEINASCEESADPSDREAFFDAVSEFHDHYTAEILDRDATIAGIRAELTQMQEFVVFEWKRKSEKSSNEKVIRTMMFHKVKRDELRSRIATREYAVGVFAPEHHAGTPPTWALKLVTSSMMSKERTRQLASYDMSVAFFHAWLERGVWVKPPKDLRLSDDWLWYVVKALCGMRESSKAFQEVVREMYTTYEWALLQTVS